MPILEKKSKQFKTTSEDTGLVYLESQRWWDHRKEYFLGKVAKFYNRHSTSENIVRAKRYDFSEKIDLKPNVKVMKKKNLLKVFENRKTSREGGQKPLDFSELSNFFSFCFSEKRALFGKAFSNSFSRTFPSPGGLFAGEVYYIAINSSVLNRGVYHYQPETNQLEALPWKVTDSDILGLIPGEDIKQHILTADGAVVLTSVFERLREKYQERYLRFALLEAGCMCQNIDLVGSSLDIKVWHQGSVDESTCRQLLKVDGVDEAILHCSVIMGK